MTSCRRSNMQNREHFVLRELTKREKKRMSSETKLGQLWIFVEPLLHMAIFSFLATSWFTHELENYPMFVLTGYVIYHFFSSATTASINSLVSNKNFLIRTRWKKNIFVKQRIYSALHDFVYSCMPYIAFMVFFHMKPGWKCLFLIPDMLLMILLAFGIGKILAVTYVFFADIQYFYENFMVMLLFASGICYPADVLPDVSRFIVECNPVYLCIEIARNSVMYNQYTGIWSWLKLAGWALTMYLFGSFIFNKKENAVMQKL